MSQPFDPATLPLHGLRLIEASAGTGKTFSLAGLYLRLIVEEKARVRDILVMTFTRAATKELRERIRARLADAARIARAPERADPNNPEHQFTLRILDNSNGNRDALAHRLAEAAARVDEATIVTIHGFAQRAASENAFESALAFDRGDNVDDRVIQRDAARDYWREQVFGASYPAATLSLWPTPARLYQAISPLLARPHAQLSGIDSARANERFRELARIWPDAVAPLTALLGEIVAAGALLKSKALYPALVDVDIPALTADLQERIEQAAADNRIPVLPEWCAHLAAPAPFFKKGARYQALATALEQNPAAPLLAELQPLGRLQAIEQAVTAVRRRADQHKLAHRQYSYDDLIQALHDALSASTGGAALAAALHQRWPWALVDEFQDTDPTQYASLRHIYLDPNRPHGALLLIGDPKQAIYGFRGGDIYAYLQAARAAGDARYTLATNYRSTQAVLDAIQALYRLPATDPFLVPEIDFPVVRAGRTSDDRRLVGSDGEQPALTFWHLQGAVKQHKNGKRKNPRKDDDRALLRRQTVTAIGRLLDGQSNWWVQQDGSTRPVAARDIAVLVNTNAEAATLQATLARHGVMAVCQHRDSVFASPEAEELQRVLRAMATPDNVVAVRACQPTALIGATFSELVRLADDDHALYEAIVRFQGCHESWARHGVLTALQTLFTRAAPDLLTLVDGERRLSNYLQLGELLATAQAECFGMASLIHWLDHQVAAATGGEPAAGDEGQLRLESDAELVRISTVHAAKGLQYPIVFLPYALWLGTIGYPDKPPLYFHDHAGQARVDLIGADGDQHKQAAVEARSEGLRLLYVALTRAEQALFVGWRAPDDSPRRAALDDLLHRQPEADTDPLATLVRCYPDSVACETVDAEQPPTTPTPRPPADPAPLAEARRDLPAPRQHWSTYSFSSLARDAAHMPSPELPVPGAGDEPADREPGTALAGQQDDELFALDHRLAGTGFGTAVHDILETRVGAQRNPGWPEPGQPATDEQRACVAGKLRSHGLIGDNPDDPRIDDTVGLVARTLHTPLPRIGPLAALQPGHFRAEMGFLLRLRGNRLGNLVQTLRTAGYLPIGLGERPGKTLYGLMQGFIDLVVEAEGRYYVLDYKTNRLGDGRVAYAEPALQRAIGEARYDLQYLIYTVALHRHLRAILGTDYDPATHLGGVQYLFLRAMDGSSTSGIFSDRPEPALIEALDRLFDSGGETQ